MAAAPTTTAPSSSDAERESAVPSGLVQHLDRADLAAASAAAAARAATVRRGAEARAKRLRVEALARRATRNADQHAQAAPSSSSADVGGAHTVSIHDREPRRVALRLRTLVLGALAVAAVAALVGGLVSWAMMGMRGSPGVNGFTPSIVSGDPVSGDVQQAIAAASPSVVSIRIQSATRHEVGSGIVLSQDGLVLTNAHVVTLDGTTRDAALSVTTADGRIFTASIVGIDAFADLAVLRLDGATGLVPATWSNTEHLAVGDAAIVLGAPLGLAGTATSGMVSATHRSIEIVSSGAPPSTDADVDPTDAPGLTPQPAPPGASTIQLAVFQTDADINPGNSGGAVVNLRGEVIGVAVAIATTNHRPDAGGSNGSIGLGFAIHGDYALRIANDLVAGRTPSHGALGASVMGSSNVTTDGPTVVGAYVDGVVDGAAAARAGIRRGDIVTAIDGLPVTGPGDLLAFVRTHPGGEVVTLTVMRQGELIEAPVTLDTAA